MTPEQKATLLKIIREHSDSATRVDAEKDLQKELQARAKTECEIDGATFRKLAAAHHKDELTELRDESVDLADLCDLVLGTTE